MGCLGIAYAHALSVPLTLPIRSTLTTIAARQAGTHHGAEERPASGIAYPYSCAPLAYPTYNILGCDK